MTPFPPIDSVMTEAIQSSFQKASLAVMSLVGLIMIARFSLLMTQAASPDRYFAVLKEAATLLIVISIFPFVLETAVSVVSEIAGRFEFEKTKELQGAMRDLGLAAKSENFWIRAVIDLGWIAVQHMVRAIFSLLLAITCSALPIILIIEFTFGARIGIQTLGTMILALLSWPILWNIIGLLASRLAMTENGTSLSGWIFSIVTNGIQLLSPLFCFSLLRSALPQSATGAVSTAANAVPFVAKAKALQALNRIRQQGKPGIEPKTMPVPKGPGSIAPAKAKSPPGPWTKFVEDKSYPGISPQASIEKRGAKMLGLDGPPEEDMRSRFGDPPKTRNQTVIGARFEDEPELYPNHMPWEPYE